MRTWLVHVTRDRWLELGVAVALGSVAASAAERLADVGTSVLAQHVGRDPSGESDALLGFAALFQAPYYLNFNAGSTVIVYGNMLSALLALVLVTLATYVVVRRRDQRLGLCPHCESRIPNESTHCAYCGSAVAPGERQPSA